MDSLIHLLPTTQRQALPAKDIKDNVKIRVTRCEEDRSMDEGSSTRQRGKTRMFEEDGQEASGMSGGVVGLPGPFITVVSYCLFRTMDVLTFSIGIKEGSTA